MRPLRVFIGFDSRQPVAYNVAQMSILQHASAPVSITPLVLPTLPISRKGLSDFTYSRFLVPWLCDYEGRAVFMDSDFLCRADIAELFKLNTGHAVHVVQHDQRTFERPSLMLFNCEKCEILTPEYVETAKNPLKLDWTQDIGFLPDEWNHLVSYDRPNPNAKMAHFTQGLPCYPEHPNLWNAEFGAEWRQMAKLCQTTSKWETLMGSSVHRPFVTGESHASN